jgi:hypothetical protein
MIADDGQAPSTESWSAAPTRRCCFQPSRTAFGRSKPPLDSWTLTWATLPMLGILAIRWLLITYVPWLTLGWLHWLGRK